jgi:hypothetical protein
MSPTGRDSNTCTTPASPCLTFNGAFAKATSGSIVELAAGTYTSSTITYVIANRLAITSAVTFQPATGATVLLGSNIDIEASHVHLIGIKSAGSGDHGAGVDNTRASLAVCANACATPLTDVYVEGFAGKSALIRSSGVTLKGGELGNYDPCVVDPTLGTGGLNPEDILRIQGGIGAATTPSDIVIDGTLIHDDDDHHDATGGCPNLGAAPRPHVDCLQAQGGTNITIQNVVMWNCATSNIQAQPFSGTIMSNWTVQNNFFGPVLSSPSNSVVLGGGAAPGNCTSIVLRYNVIAGSQPNASGCATNALGNISAYGNVFLSDAGTLATNVTYGWNVFTNASTAALNSSGNHDNKECSVALVNPTATGTTGPNYHLQATDTCAKNAGDPLNFPSTDIDGQSRPSPAGTAPDAGADEIP